MLRSIIFSSLLFNAGILLGRISGFIRESFVGAIYGVGADADTVVLMLTIPDILVNILVGGALGSVFVPEFVRRPKRARQLLLQTICLFGFLFFVLAACIYFNIEFLISILAPGFSDSQNYLTSNSVRLVVLLLPLAIMSGLTTAFLHAKNQYGIPAIGTMIVNCSVIIGLIIVSMADAGMYILPYFILLGGLLRLLSQTIKVGHISIPSFKSFKPLLINKDLIIRYIQALVSGSTLILFPVVARSQATYLESGSIAVLNYATKLIELPMALSVTFISVVLLPKLSKSYAKDSVSHAKVVQYGMQATLVLSILVACSLSAISGAYTSIVFGYGKITPYDLDSISHLVSEGMLLLPLMGISIYLTSVYNSRKNTLIPLVVNLLGLIAFILIYKSSVYGNSLSAIMLSMISGYALISITLIAILRVDGVRWLEVLFEARFFTGVVTGGALINIVCRYIQGLGILNWQVIVLAAFSSVFFLSIIALLNNELRERLMIKIQRV